MPPTVPLAPRSAIAGVVWPALPDAATARLLAVMWQLDASQWWTADQLCRHQRSQLAALLVHAATTVPHYEDAFASARLDATTIAAAHAVVDDAWARVPILTRRGLIDAGPRILRKRYPSPHGRVEDVDSSRSTGDPVRVKSTDVVLMFWHALTLRDHLWHRRDLSAHLAAIRLAPGKARAPDGLLGAEGWARRRPRSHPRRRCRCSRSTARPTSKSRGSCARTRSIC